MKTIRKLRSFDSQSGAKFIMNKSTLEPLALKFANYLVKGQYGCASKMIVAEKQAQWNSDWIKSEYLEMIEYG